jgi:transcriptional regulator NrdR family protein
MLCPKCHSKLKTIRTEPTAGVVKRQRGCPNCGRRWDTIERAEDADSAIAIRAKRVLESAMDELSNLQK